MEKDWVMIYSSAQLHIIKITKALLEENNINVIEINKMDSSYNFGDIELYVKAENVMKAKYYIDKNKL